MARVAPFSTMAAPPRAQTDTVGRVRVVAGGAVGLAAGFGGMIFGSLAIFLKPIAADFGWTRAQTSAALIMSMLGLAIGAPVLGRLMERFGRRVVIGGSVLALGVMLAALSLVARSHLLFGLCWLLLGATAAATGPNGYLALLPTLFDRRLGLALSCAMIGVGLGAAGGPVLAQTLIHAQGWRFAYRAFALIALAGGGLALLLIGRSASSGSAHAAAIAPPIGLNFREGLQDRRLWQIALALGLASACGLGITIQAAAMLDDRGFNGAQIASVVALSGVGVLFGRLSAGALMDVVSARVVGAGNYVAGAAGVALLGLGVGHAYPTVAAGGLMLGLALGAEGDFAAFAVRRYAGSRAFSSLYGVTFSAFSLGSIVGVIACGWAYDHFGNYRLASAACVAGYLVAAVLIAALGPYRYATFPQAQGA